MSSIILKISNLSQTVISENHHLKILDNLSFEMNHGETVAITGSSGSGKSTLLGLLAGLNRSTSGQINLLGQGLSELNEEQRAALRRDKIAFVFQSFQLMPHLTALENVMLPIELRLNSDINVKQIRERAANLLKKVGLENRVNHYPTTLSGGEQQRVALARAFVTKPQILFADEPTGSLDTANGEMIANYLFELNQQSKVSLVLVTHDASLAQRCQRIIQLQAGSIISDTKTSISSALN